MSLFKRISAIVAEEGTLAFSKKVLRICAFTIFRISKAIVFEWDLEKSANNITQQMNLSFRLATEKDIERMDKEVYYYNRRAKRYSIERLKKGDRCVLALSKEIIVGYMWIMKDCMELTQSKHIRISEKRAYIYNAFVPKDYRGKRILAAMDIHVIEILRKENKKYMLTTVMEDNKPPMKAKERLPWKEVGRMRVFRFLGLHYAYLPKKTLNYLGT
jgi:ribosomal protein S18 acetylase RimI-like enzyme